MSIDKMLSELKDINELKKFAEAQNKTILNLSKELKETKEKTKHLEKLLESTVPTIPLENNKFEKEDEQICIRQLILLNDLSNERELTLEECKKVDTYSKLLQNLNSVKKEEVPQARSIETKDLLKLIKNDTDE
jgi:hypothetical protein